MKKTDSKLKIFPSPFLLGCIVFCVVFSIGIFVLFMLTPNFIEQCNEHIWYWFALIFMLIILPFILLLVSARRFLSIVTIDESGISRSVFGRFYKLSMRWDDIYEVSYFESGLPFLIISKTKSIQGKSYWKISKIKDLIQIQLSQRNYDQIKKYLKQPIVGLTEAKMSQLKLKK